MTTNDSISIFTLAERLVDSMSGLDHVVVAFSGGVDSSVVANAAYLACQQGLLKSAIAVTAISPSVATWQVEMASEVAAQIGLPHQTISTTEIDDPDYRRNDHRRCFYCKQTLYQTMRSMTRSIGQTHPDCVILSGTNADDAGDYRPGIEAGSVAEVKTPLLDLGFDKSTVRKLAHWFGLANAKQPASPCLASRIAYNTPVTISRLQRIDRAESWLRDQEFDIVRVRTEQTHPTDPEADHARIEVDLPQVDRLRQLNRNGFVIETLIAMGFRSVAIDPLGFRSGNLNDSLELVSLSSSTLDPSRE